MICEQTSRKRCDAGFLSVFDIFHPEEGWGGTGDVLQ